MPQRRWRDRRRSLFFSPICRLRSVQWQKHFCQVYNKLFDVSNRPTGMHDRKLVSVLVNGIAYASPRKWKPDISISSLRFFPSFHIFRSVLLATTKNCTKGFLIWIKMNFHECAWECCRTGKTSIHGPHYCGQFNHQMIGFRTHRSYHRTIGQIAE